MKLGLAPAHFQVATWLCLRVVSELLNQVGEGQVEGFSMFWSEETEVFFLGEGNRKLFPSRGLVSVLGLSTVLLGD